jgi:hypothetical protein
MIKKQVLLLSLLSFTLSTLAQFQKKAIISTGKGSSNEILYDSTNEKEKIPLEGMDFTWVNGGDRRDSSVLSGKFFTPLIMVDANATHSFNNPIDNTVVGSTALARDNEMQISSANLGGDFNYNGARAHIVTQFGTRSTVIPRNDLSPYRGQYQLANVYRYLAEANAGYHFKKWYGINIDFGMFMSYIGLNSYYQVENWEYQASFTSDNTPWFFNGMRIQIFPTKHLKIEPWLINGWQSYGTFNKQPGVGGNITWQPTTAIKLLSNDYYGADDALDPGRKRFHSDNSALLRYFNRPASKGISKMAFSATFDIGFEKGDGVNGFHSSSTLGPAQFFVSGMIYNRVWFYKNKFVWTMGGGFMNNPGRYLVLAPSGDASPLPNQNNPTTTEGTHPFSMNPGDQFTGWDCSTNLGWLVNQSIEFRIEAVHRHASTGYFAGHGGVTSPTGYTTTALPPNWAPDLVQNENRVIFAILFRM